MQANKYIHHSFIYYNGNDINIYLLKLIKKGSLLLKEGRRNTHSTAYTILMGIKEGGFYLKIILISIQLLTPNLTL